MNNNYTDIEHLKLVAQRLAEAGRDITADYADWINVTFACASLGEQAREAYHTICSLYSGYKREECDEVYQLSEGRQRQRHTGHADEDGPGCRHRHQPAPWSPTEVCSTEEEGAGEPHQTDA